MKRIVFVILVLTLMVATPLRADDISLASDDIFKAKCAFCHGANGEGKAAMKIAPLNNSASKSVDQLVDVITNGKGKMPAYDGRLTHDQSVILAKKIKLLSTSTTAATQPTSPQSTTEAQPTTSGPFTPFTNDNILRDIKPRLGNCNGKINVTNVKVLDKIPDAGIAEIEVTANWVAPYNVWATPLDCLGFSQSGGKTQKARMKVRYEKWESGWKFSDILLF